MVLVSSLVSITALIFTVVALSKQVVKTHESWAKARDTYIMASHDLARIIKFAEKSPFVGGNGVSEKTVDPDAVQAMRHAAAEREAYEAIVREDAEQANRVSAQAGAQFGVDPNRL